jgi:hypothetical protein
MISNSTSDSDNSLHSLYFTSYHGLINYPPKIPAMVGDQAVHPLQQERLAPLVDAGDAEAPARMQDFDGDVVHEQVDHHGHPPHQPYIVF